MHDPSSQAQAELSAAASWNAEDVAAWLVQNDLDRYSARFWENRVTGAALLGITYEDLRRLGVLNLKHRARILNAVAELKGSGVRLQPRSKSSGVLQTRSETCPSTTSNISPGPYSAPLPQDIPFGLLQHSDDTYFAPQPPIPPSSLRASLNVSSIPAIPPRTKSIEAFPVGWDARLSVPAHVLTSDHEEHAASTVIQFQELQFEEHKVMQELPPRLDSHLAPSLRIQSSYQQPPLFPAREDSLLDASPVDFAVVSPAGSAGHRTSCYEDDGHDLGFLPALINDGVFDDKLSDKSSEHNLYPDTRPTGRARANSSGALKRHPAIREHRSRSPLPQARESEVNRPIRRPHLAITTNLGMSHHHTSVTSLESPGSVGSKSSTVESLTREPQIKAVHVNDHSKMRSPNIEATKSLTDGSPMSPMSSSFRDGSFYEKDSIMGISSIRDRCIRVTGTDYQSHIIDVAALTNPEAIRERIYTKFNIQGDDEKEQYGIFSLDFSGNLDIGKWKSSISSSRIWAEVFVTQKTI
ncbi:hypothetical protein DFJ77DRAFT_2058 [Powellomyces hirtus]|nr:hypothetical protein DFJ77DRAFT_2058 [Powellomyces hirtus]